MSLMPRSAFVAVLAFAVVSGAIARDPVAVGQTAPDFTLRDQDGNSITLSKQRNQVVVLLFYRGYW